MGQIDFDSIVVQSLEDLLSRVSEKEIYEYYLQESIKENQQYKCPFHKDTNPSLGFKLMPSNMLIHRCFSCGKRGSVINFVSRLFNISSQEAVRQIYRDLNLSLRGPVSSPITTRKRVESVGFTAEDNTVILPEKQTFNIVDYNYWKQYYISLKTLVEYSISSCKRVIIKKVKENKLVLFAEYSNTNPIYSYEINGKYKIYRPLNPTKYGKWISTTKAEDIQGLRELPKSGELLIITSSMKDLLVLKTLGYSAIALGGEGNRIPAKLLDYLYACFKEILVFYDNDEAGIMYGKKFSSEIGSEYIYIPQEYKEKDISDFIARYGIDQTRSLLKELIINGRNKREGEEISTT